MGQYNFCKTGEVTDLSGEIVGHVDEAGSLHLLDEAQREDVLHDLHYQVSNDQSVDWSSALLSAAMLPTERKSGEIRLACIHCDTDEADFVDEFPEHWEILGDVQSVDDSLKPSVVGDSSRAPFDWYTHLGVCPCCQRRESGD